MITEQHSKHLPLEGPIVLVASSNGRTEQDLADVAVLQAMLEKEGFDVELSPNLADRGDGTSGSPGTRAAAINKAWAHASAIIDVSGGNRANEILRWIDYEAASKSSAVFVGYSDLTTVMTGLLAKVKKPSLLFQPINLLRDPTQWTAFIDWLRGGTRLCEFDVDAPDGDNPPVEGHLVGGNLRCLLKLAGTPYLPSLKGGILLLEALGTDRDALPPCLPSLNRSAQSIRRQPFSLALSPDSKKIAA